MSDINISYGGQAVIGGVLIQSPKGWSLGIRDKDDNLHRYYEPCLLYTSDAADE